MPHGSLGIERVAVRRSANAGKGFRETHGLLGNLGKLFHVAVRRGRRTLQADRKKFSEYAVHPCGSPLPHALQGFAANAMPCAEVRPECDQGGFPHRAPFRPGHPCPTARPRPGHTRETWAPLGCTCTAWPRHDLAETPRNAWGFFSINTKICCLYTSCSTTYTRRQYNACSYTIT